MVTGIDRPSGGEVIVTDRERRGRARHLLEPVGLADRADEPTGNPDARTAEAVFDLFIGLVDQGKTSLMVTHNHYMARRVSRRIEMADGRITRDERLAAPAA
jgi:ABC-type lipoprotein export system ATPase subunit